MKKYICLILSALLMVSLCISANAQSVATISGADTVAVGKTVELTIALSDMETVSTLGVSVKSAGALKVVSGQFLKNGAAASFDAEKGNGVMFVGATGTSLNGNLLKVVLKGESYSATETVTVTVLKLSGKTPVTVATATKSVQVVCASHNFGKATQVDAKEHTKTCTTCGYSEKSAHTWDDGIVTSIANCTAPGTKRFECTSCGAIKTEVLPAGENHKYGNFKTIVKATCTAAGSEERVCSVCNKIDSRTIPAVGHQLQSSAKIVKEATCTETGVATGKCGLCYKSVSTVIPAKGHHLSSYTVTQKPTCTEEGVKEGACTTCGEKAQLPVPANGHFYDDGAVVKEPTYTETGTLRRKCTFCDATKDEPVPQLKQEEKDENKTDVSVQPEEEKGIAPWIIIVGAVVLAVLIVGGIVLFIILKKKKAEKTPSATTGENK